MNAKQSSSCCKADLRVSTGNEGTSCFICGDCKNPCDVIIQKIKSAPHQEGATEFDDAVRLARKLLDEPYADPDDDLRMLSRQLLRTVERNLMGYAGAYQDGKKDEAARIAGMGKCQCYEHRSKIDSQLLTQIFDILVAEVPRETAMVLHDKILKLLMSDGNR